MAVPFVHVQAKGSYRELGRAVGEAARPQIEESLAFYREHFGALGGGLAFDEAQRKAAAYGEYARRYVPFVELLVPNCGEELTSVEPVVGVAADFCTAAAVVSRGRRVVGHNMDWYGVDTATNVLFDLTVPDGTRILGIAGAPYLLMLGMNSHGIANVSNSVSSTDNRVGVPNVVVRRWSLEASSLEEAAARGALRARARGTNHFLADQRGRLWDLETSATATAFADHTSGGLMAHTNHYTSAAIEPFEGSLAGESRVRLATAERLLADGRARDDDPVEIVARVLRSHEGAPDECICAHHDDIEQPAGRTVTVASMICDLDERRLYACAGQPCENPYRVFTM
jgi:isopenicillin-N N-acyltransferase-like protein